MIIKFIILSYVMKQAGLINNTKVLSSYFCKKVLEKIVSTYMWTNTTKLSIVINRCVKMAKIDVTEKTVMAQDKGAYMSRKLIQYETSR